MMAGRLAGSSQCGSGRFSVARIHPCRPISVGRRVPARGTTGKASVDNDLGTPVASNDSYTGGEQRSGLQLLGSPVWLTNDTDPN